MYNIYISYYIYMIIYMYDYFWSIFGLFLLDVGFSAFHWFDALASMDNWTGSPRRPLPRLQLELVEAAFHLLWHGKKQMEGRYWSWRYWRHKGIGRKKCWSCLQFRKFPFLKAAIEGVEWRTPGICSKPFQDFWLCLVVHGLENTAQSPVPPFSTGLKTQVTQSIGRGKFTGHSP